MIPPKYFINIIFLAADRLSSFKKFFEKKPLLQSKKWEILIPSNDLQKYLALLYPSK